MSTKKGRELANKLAPSIGFPDGIFQTCSLIARHATTHNRIQEARCNGHPCQGNPNIPADKAAKIQDRYDKWLDKREAQIERRICELVATLPEVNGQPIGAYFGGDPRGNTVKLIMPDGRYDDWGQEGLCVPQE